jgi:hypothetical protein
MESALSGVLLTFAMVGLHRYGFPRMNLSPTVKDGLTNSVEMPDSHLPEKWFSDDWQDTHR